MLRHLKIDFVSDASCSKWVNELIALRQILTER